MRILIVTQYFWPESFRINDLALGLQQVGHDVTVLTGKPNYPAGKFFAGYGFFNHNRDDYKGVRIVRVPMVPRGAGTARRLVVNYLSFAFFASLYSPFVCRGEYDLIFVYEPSPITVGLPAMLLKRIKRIPLMFWVQDLWPESLSATGAVRSNRLLRLVEKLVRFIYANCDLILAQSRAFFAPIEKLGVPSERILYFPNSAEDLYRPVIVRRDAPERAAMPDGFRVMFAGNIGKAQDFETILGAATILKSHPDIHWLILGDGRMSEWVRQQVDENELNGTVHLLGRQPIETMPSYFSMADVMLVTLKKKPIFSMTVPAKVQSYLACGRPLIAALEGEGAKIVREARAGYTTLAEDPQGLANSVLAMYQLTEAERQAIGNRGRQYFEEHFERNMLLARLDNWMKQLSDTTQPCGS